jgi:hypothetical protein
MRALFLLALVSLTAHADDSPGRFARFCDRTAQGRTTRGLQCDDLAFFEAFPASGAGTTTACSTTAPTGAKGETLTFTRASPATCTPDGLATSGIATGSLVELTNNVARVERDANLVLGLRVESSRTNSLFRFIDFANALWADVGTPTLTGSQTSPFSGTYANSAVLFDDNDGAAFEGRSQTVTVTAAAAYTMHCYVRADTATTARIVLDGTAATITGLSSTTWSIIEVTDASSSGVAIVAEVDVGNVASVTGTVTFGGCQVEAGSYRTSIIPTVAATVTRSAETATFPGSTWPVSPVSFASSVVTPWSGTATAADMFAGNVGSNSGWAFGWTGGTLRSQPCTGGVCGTLDVSQGPTALVASRWAVSYSGADTSIYKDAVLIAGPAARTAPNSPWNTNTAIASGTSWGHLNGIISRICVDPSPTRCR